MRITGGDDGSKACRVAIVGAGYMAGEHIRAFKDAGAEIVGIHSRTRDRADRLAAEHGIPGVCSSVSQLYEGTGAELVVVTVPELAANQVSQAAFGFPWAVLLEKPAGYDLRDAQAIVEEARSRGSRAFVALNRRFHSSTFAAWQDLLSDEGPKLIQVLDQQDQTVARAAGQPEEVVANWHFANSIHVIDFLRVFGRTPILAVDPVEPWDRERPGVVVSRVRYDNGDIGLYEGIWNGPGPWAAIVTAPSRRWELRPLEQAAVQARGERRLTPIEIESWDTAFKPGLRAQAAAAIAAARHEQSSLPTLEDAFHTMRLIEAIFADHPTSFSEPLPPAGVLQATRRSDGKPGV